jgi:hypothetical protein
MRLVIFVLLCILPAYATETSTDLAQPLQHGIRKKKATLTTENDGKLLFISSDIKSSFFDTEGLAPNTVVKLINIYKDFGVDFKKTLCRRVIWRFFLRDQSVIRRLKKRFYMLH